MGYGLELIKWVHPGHVFAMVQCTWGSCPPTFVRDTSVNDRVRHQSGTEFDLSFLRPEIVVLQKLYDL
jgi:hypothetical protein